jgi:hypothetical protein
VLRSFRFSNHRSFRDEQELLLIPAYDKDRAAVPVAAIYGANAAGKSNLLDALRFMAEAVRDSYRSWRPEDGVPRRPFVLPRSASDASVYVVELVLEGVRHTYGFSVDDELVQEEWLYAYPHRNRRRIVFERRGQNVTLGSSVTEHRAKVDVLADLTRPNALFLSLTTQVGLPEVLAVDGWFTRQLLFSSGPATERSLAAAVTTHLTREPRNHARLLGLLRAADLGISGLVIEEDEVTKQLVAAAEERRWRAERELEEARSTGVHGATVDRLFMTLGETAAELDHLQNVRQRRGSQRLRLAHGAAGELLDITDESAGTRAWLQLLTVVLDVLDSGSPIVIDEIDSSLHPELAARLIRLFQSEDLNPRSAQLLFTTHDATLLGTSFGEEVLGRDQVWFVEKGSDGSSRLYPLTDFHPRQNENRERRYLNGSYGAIPITSDLAVERAVVPEGPRDVAAS